MPGQPGSGGGMVRPAPKPGFSGLGGIGGGAASRPGGGFATRPSPSLRPGQLGGPVQGGGNGGGNRPGVTTLPGQLPGGGAGALPGNRPGLGPTTKPSFPGPNFPGPGGSLAGGNRPGGGGNRPTTLPGDIGAGNRPGVGGNRPTTLPGDIGGNRPGIGGNRPGQGGDRPGIGGNRPGIGGNRPTTLPGDLAGFGNRPGGSRPNRPGIGGNRPGIGDGNAIWNNGNFNSGNFNNNFNNNNFNNVHVGGGYGGWGYPGGGYGGWGYGGGYGGGSGWVNPHYGNWYNGGWNGNWGGYNGGWWAPFAAGAATWGLLSSVGNWGLGYGTLGYGAAGYVNPYYSAVPAAVVAASPYDYSQPVFVDSSYASGQAAPVVEGTQPADDSQAAAQVSPADVAVDEALAKFKAGDYAGALAGFDKALRLSPKDSVIHEVRALALFALGRYSEAAATLNSVLASAPGMDWTTVSNVYGSVDAYTGHLRKLEDFCRTHPDDAAAHFVLGYQYLVGGSSDMAAAALRVVIAKQPGDVVAKRLLDAIAPAAQDQAQPAPTAESASQGATARPAAEQALPEIDLVGTWKATSGKDTIQLTVTADSKFTWKAQPDGKPTVTLDGSIETTADAVALVSESAGTMVAKVTPKTADSFEFSLAAAPKDTPPLLFTRQP